MKQIYLTSKFRKRFYWLALVSSLVFFMMAVLNLFYFDKANFEEDPIKELAYLVVGVNALIFGITHWFSYYYAKKPIISYSKTDFYIHKRNLFSKEWNFKKEDIQAKLLVTGDIGIQIDENTYEIFKESVNQKDFDNLIDYLDIKENL